MQALLEIDKAIECRVIRRINRFVVEVDLGGGRALAHTNNTGNLTGILERGRRGFCLPKEAGKTRLRLVAVECPRGRAALIDTRLQMLAFEEALERGLIPWLRGCRVARRNPRALDSTLDYLLNCDGREVYIEVKSAVYRMDDGSAAYPDPASARGRRHVRTLARLASQGLDALLLFIAAIPGPRAFRLNAAADPLLPRLVREAVSSGVLVKAIALHYNPPLGAVVLESADLPVIL